MSKWSQSSPGAAKVSRRYRGQFPTRPGTPDALVSVPASYVYRTYSSPLVLVGAGHVEFLAAPLAFGIVDDDDNRAERRTL